MTAPNNATLPSKSSSLSSITAIDARNTSDTPATPTNRSLMSQPSTLSSSIFTEARKSSVTTTIDVHPGG